MLSEFLNGGSAEQVQTIEAKYGLHLEESYRDFLIASNGVISKEETEVELPGSGHRIVLDSLFGLNVDRKWLNFETWMDMYADELPENTAIIGTDSMNGFMVLISSGENAGV